MEVPLNPAEDVTDGDCGSAEACRASSAMMADVVGRSWDPYLQLLRAEKNMHTNKTGKSFSFKWS